MDAAAALSQLLKATPFLSPFCGPGSPLAVNPMRGSPSRSAR